MIRIGIHNKKDLDLNSFKSEISSLCKSQKDNDKALAFAFIVYDFKNPSIRKILKDDEYWDSLNSISGNRLGVFYLDTKESSNLKSSNIGINNSIIDDSYSTESRDYNSSRGFSMMTKISISPITLTTTNHFIKQLFNIENNIETPFIIFFQANSEEEILDSFFVQLNKNNIEESYKELEEIITKAVESVESVKDENKFEDEAIFNLIKNRLINSNKKLFPISLGDIASSLTIADVILKIVFFLKS